MTEGPGLVLVVNDDPTNRLLLTRGLEPLTVDVEVTAFAAPRAP
jgi:hypothetical protein